MDELTKDMCNLAKIVYDISKKHGNIYINVSRHDEFRQSSCSYKRDGALDNVEYWARGNQFTRKISEKLKYK